MEREISNMLMESRDNTQRVRDSFRFQCLLGASEENFKKSRLDIATSCIQHIAEKASLSELYRKKIAELRLQLSVKEDVICALQHDLKSKCLKQQLPEIALQLAAVVERKDQKNTEFISIVSDLLAHNINEKKCWNDDTKSLFAIILDYGGPALLKIIREKIGGPSLQTAYATARRKVPIATKLTEDQFGIAASFYQRVGYTGPFVLAIDATAISPCLRNVAAALRILQPEVRECLSEWNKDRSQAIRVYLKVGHNMLRAYTDENLTVKERSKLAWSSVCFVRLWKAWVEMSNYPIESSFISLQTYNDIVLAGHSLILSRKLFSEYFPDQSFNPSTFGSDSCERLFARCRGFCKGKTNFCMLDMLDICGRIAKLDELKLKEPPVVSRTSWPEFVEDEILSGIKEAEKEVLKTIEGLGMLPLLAAGNILRLDDSGDILYINPGIEALADIRDGPDESDTITVEELLDVENDVLCSAAETNEHCYSFALSDLAASSIPRSNAFDREEGGEENGDVDDDDDPRHCHLFQKGTCKYANPAFKAPKTTHWIGCDYPGCDNWFHESCLNLKFCTDSERETYAFVCTSHGNVKGMEQYKDLVAATASDISMMEEDEQNEGTFHLKRRRRFNYGEKTSAASQCSVPPNYVEYDGEFYHIAEFLSLQQGKVYKPSTSRMARWMAVSRNDFYERVERLVAPTRSENGLYFEDIAAFWVPRLGMRCGLVLRLVRDTFSKSPVPVFEWKKGNDSKEKKYQFAFKFFRS
ncbi:unnamed protein product [Porites lobata]|uniref:Zinc finger PHD-type domain-containing protein n=1 Tax=Porites lobata TaxID=104759 RepID=A0ABN8NMZ6_9CNID|nr:unnamed protein product [Porites lobata]